MNDIVFIGEQIHQKMHEICETHFQSLIANSSFLRDRENNRFDVHTHYIRPLEIMITFKIHRFSTVDTTVSPRELHINGKIIIRYIETQLLIKLVNIYSGIPYINQVIRSKNVHAK